ncbi:hypothetical protein [Streptomyces cyaneofuscatus]|uniref:hypothetical protein n=1 Tax=Streptomyces cyaneofuscatus TaxID=66883 RepID=UPI003868FB4A
MDLVQRGAADEGLLDTYQSEREPHVRAVTEKGIELGHLQTLRDPDKAAERDRRLLARRAEAGAPEAIRLPGLFARTSAAGRGQLSVQGVVDDGTRRDRLDQIAGGGFHLLVREELLDALASAHLLDGLTSAGVRVVVPGERTTGDPGALFVHDVDGTYRDWFTDLSCSAVVVRPDFYVFGTAGTPDAAVALAGELLGTLRKEAALPRG